MWQAESLAAGEAAATAVARRYELGVITDLDIEEIASEVHEAWLACNSEWAAPEQKIPYPELTETEKVKDRIQVLRALDLIAQRGLERRGDRLR